jgi:hypothetical protein
VGGVASELFLVGQDLEIETAAGPEERQVAGASPVARVVPEMFIVRQLLRIQNAKIDSMLRPLPGSS